MSALPGALVGIITRFQTQYVGFGKIFFDYIEETTPPSQDSDRGSKMMDGIARVSPGRVSMPAKAPSPDGYAALYPS